MTYVKKKTGLKIVKKKEVADIHERDVKRCYKRVRSFEALEDSKEVSRDVL